MTDTGYKKQDAGCKIQVTGYKMQDTGYEMSYCPVPLNRNIFYRKGAKSKSKDRKYIYILFFLSVLSVFSVLSAVSYYYAITSDFHHYDAQGLRDRTSLSICYLLKGHYP